MNAVKIRGHKGLRTDLRMMWPTLKLWLRREADENGGDEGRGSPQTPGGKTKRAAKAKGTQKLKPSKGRQKPATDTPPNALGRNERRLLDSDAVAEFEEI